MTQIVLYVNDSKENEPTVGSWSTAKAFEINNEQGMQLSPYMSWVGLANINT